MSGGTLSIWRQAAVLCLAFFALALAGACSTDDKDSDYVEGSVEQLYNSAMDLMLAERYEPAAKMFDEVDRQHPYSIWATKAQLMGAYAHYRNQKLDEAVVALDRYIQLHPSSRDVTYAYYLKGLANFEQIKDVKRDQVNAREALKTFEEMLRRFPVSQYSRDAKRKIDLIRAHLAGKEMEVGRYYQRRGKHLAAINRFKTVIERYQTTSQVPEALHRLAESYTALGMTDEAQKAAAVLGYNYPGSQWYTDSYELVKDEKIERPDAGSDDNRPALVRAWDWLF